MQSKPSVYEPHGLLKSQQYYPSHHRSGKNNNQLEDFRNSSHDNQDPLKSKATHNKPTASNPILQNNNQNPTGRNPYEDYKVKPHDYTNDNTNGFDLMSPINTTTNRKNPVDEMNNNTQTPKNNIPSYLEDPRNRKASDCNVNPNDKGPLHQIQSSPFSKHENNPLSNQVILSDNVHRGSNYNNNMPGEQHAINQKTPHDKTGEFDFNESPNNQSLNEKLDTLEDDIKKFYPDEFDFNAINKSSPSNEPLNKRLDTLEDEIKKMYTGNKPSNAMMRDSTSTNQSNLNKNSARDPKKQMSGLQAVSPIEEDFNSNIHDVYF